MSIQAGQCAAHSYPVYNPVCSTSSFDALGFAENLLNPNLIAASYGYEGFGEKVVKGVTGTSDVDNTWSAAALYSLARNSALTAAGFISNSFNPALRGASLGRFIISKIRDCQEGSDKSWTCFLPKTIGQTIGDTGQLVSNGMLFFDRFVPATQGDQLRASMAARRSGGQAPRTALSRGITYAVFKLAVSGLPSFFEAMSRSSRKVEAQKQQEL